MLGFPPRCTRHAAGGLSGIQVRLVYALEANPARLWYFLSALDRSFSPCRCGGRAPRCRREISSRSIVSMSRAGSMEPSTWIMSSFSKQRTTWTTASTSRMLERNLLPRPSPLDAPFTRPAMSTNSIVAGVNFSGLYIFSQLVEALVRHGNDADVRLNGAERVVRRLRARVGDRVEKGALADVLQIPTIPNFIFRFTCPTNPHFIWIFAFR